MDTLEQAFDLTGRVAIVTGGAGFLGQEYCRALSAAGADVISADIAPAGDTEGRHFSSLSGSPRRLSLRVDVSDPDSVDSMVRKTIQEFGRLDILVNNAGMTVEGGARAHNNYFASVEDYPLSTWNRAVEIGLTGTFLCSQRVGKEMAGSGGVMINICSIYGLVGPDQRIYSSNESQHDSGLGFNTPASYSAIKGGVLALTRYLAAYWAGKNIRVNALTPGGVYNEHDPAFVERYSARTPMARMGNVSEFHQGFA